MTFEPGIKTVAHLLLGVYSFTTADSRMVYAWLARRGKGKHGQRAQ